VGYINTVGKGGWEDKKGGGKRWWPSFINTHVNGLYEIIRQYCGIPFVRIPPSFTKGKARRIDSCVFQGK
jgi:hypothetical protein